MWFSSSPPPPQMALHLTVGLKGLINLMVYICNRPIILTKSEVLCKVQQCHYLYQARVFVHRHTIELIPSRPHFRGARLWKYAGKSANGECLGIFNLPVVYFCTNCLQKKFGFQVRSAHVLALIRRGVSSSIAAWGVVSTNWLSTEYTYHATLIHASWEIHVARIFM